MTDNVLSIIIKILWDFVEMAMCRLGKFICLLISRDIP